MLRYAVLSVVLIFNMRSNKENGKILGTRLAHPGKTGTLTIRKAATSQGKKHCRRLTEINSHYYGVSLMRTLTQGPHGVA